MNPLQLILILGVRAYRWVLSPAKQVLFGPLGRCRFSPSCSAYALEAIQRHGAIAGIWLALHRIGRCHPWGDCGHDPVPEPKSRPGRLHLTPLDPAHGAATCSHRACKSL